MIRLNEVIKKRNYVDASREVDKEVKMEDISKSNKIIKREVKLSGADPPDVNFRNSRLDALPSGVYIVKLTIEKLL